MDTTFHAQLMHLASIYTAHNLCELILRTHILKKLTMPSTHSFLQITILVLLYWLSFKLTNAQPTMAECGPNLLSLAPCTPFVQGGAPSPVQLCCDGLKMLYRQKPACLCLLFNDTAMTSFPSINTTLALQLPHLCDLQVDTSICPGASPPSVSPLGANPNSTVAASPVVTITPRPSIIGFGSHHNAQVRLKAEGQLMMMLLSTILAVVINIAR